MVPARLPLALLASLLTALALAAAAQAKPGDVYLADQNASIDGSQGALFVFGPGGGTAERTAQSSLAEGPVGLAFDRGGRLLLGSDDAHGRILRVNPLTGSFSTFLDVPQLQRPRGLAFGPDGMLYVLDFLPGTISRVNPATKAVKEVVKITGPPFQFPGELVVNRKGTIFVTDADADAVFRVNSRTGATSTLQSGPELDGADGIALSPDETVLHVTAGDGNQVTRLRARDGAVVRQIPGFATPVSLALLPSGASLVSNRALDSIARIGIGGGTPTVFSADPRLEQPEDILVEPPRCAGQFPTVVGSARRDVLTGSRFRDLIRGLGGNDLICGGGGADTLVGGPGRDLLLGGPGGDLLLGGKGRDRLRGGPGRDQVRQ